MCVCVLIEADLLLHDHVVYCARSSSLASSDEKRVSMLLDWHRIVPTFALSAGFRFWTKISMKETFFMDDSKYTEFRTEVDFKCEVNSFKMED